MTTDSIPKTSGGGYGNTQGREKAVHETNYQPVTVPLLKKPDEVQDLDKKHTVCHLTPNGITGYSSATDKE